MRLTNAGDTAALEAMFRDDSAGSGGAEGSEYGVDELVLTADDLRLTSFMVPDEYTVVTLSITGGDEDYVETARFNDDGTFCFHVPRQRVGAEITVSMTIKIIGHEDEEEYVVRSGTKTLVAGAGCQFSIVMKTPMPADFVPVDGDLYMCVHEVADGEYGNYCGYVYGADWRGYYSGEDLLNPGPGHSEPVYHVSWYDALVYCNLRSINEGLAPCYSIGGKTNPSEWAGIMTGFYGKPRGPDSNASSWDNVTVDTSKNGYRLPTSAEWERAAKGGPANDNFRYSGSNSIGSVAWHSGNSDNRTHLTEMKAPNSLGLYDMTGNVAEWCWDKSASSSARVYRGGSFSSSTTDCRITSKKSSSPSSRLYTVGFRIVRKAD